MALKQHFNREILKNKIGEENIFTHYFGPWNLGGSYSSVFREDQKNSTGFYISKNGSLIYNDLRTNDKYDFVHFVMKKYTLNYYEAIDQIAVDFGLKTGVRSSSKPAVITAFKQAKKAKIKAITVTSTTYKQQHIDYWLQFGITKNELILNNIYAIKDFVINTYDEAGNLLKKFECTPDSQLRFAFSFTKGEEQYLKIYSPYSKDIKWIGNCPIDIPFGLDTLPYKTDTLIITKSVKDCLVLRKFHPDVIGLQNESSSACPDELVQQLKERYKNVIIWFDYDRPGIAAANYYKRKYNFPLYFTMHNHNSVWKNLTKVRGLKIKDPSDLVLKYGLKTFEDYFKYIKIIK